MLDIQRIAQHDISPFQQQIIELLAKKTGLQNEKLSNSNENNFAEKTQDAKDEEIKQETKQETPELKIEPIREIPKNAIKVFEESYIIKRGKIITTAVDIHVSLKDANIIKNGSIENFEKEIARITKLLGVTAFNDTIRKTIKWAADEKYETEKSPTGDLDISLELLAFLSKKEIKIGNTLYKVPEEVFQKK